MIVLVFLLATIFYTDGSFEFRIFAAPSAEACLAAKPDKKAELIAEPGVKIVKASCFQTDDSEEEQ